MSVQRALEVLGLSGSPSAEEVRRAYLRQVKQHPPERDREGFQLVREAYDCLKAVQAWVRLHEARAGTEPVALGDSAAAREPTSFEPASQPAPSALAPSEHAGPVLDEPSEPAPPEPAIALPDDVARDMQRLQQALDRDDPATAAEVMITLYSRPAHDGGPVPPPLRVCSNG